MWTKNGPSETYDVIRRRLRRRQEQVCPLLHRHAHRDRPGRRLSPAEQYAVRKQAVVQDRQGLHAFRRGAHRLHVLWLGSDEVRQDLHLHCHVDEGHEHRSDARSTAKITTPISRVIPTARSSPTRPSPAPRRASHSFYRLLTDSTRKTYSTTYNTFKDVPAKAWYNTAVSTMAKLGIVNGGSDGYFRPSDPITRAEIAAMIARCDGNSYGNAYTNFSDVKGHWAANYIARAYELGWINGYGTTYAPDKYISRAETVAILNRVLNRAPQTTSDLLSGLNTFNDVSVTSWYYLDVEEAANSHTYTRKTNDYEYWDKPSPTRAGCKT